MSRRELIAKALSEATPQQLFRVRHILNHFGNGTWDSNQDMIGRVLEHFDLGQYDSERIEYWLDDETLAIALSTEPYFIDGSGHLVRLGQHFIFKQHRYGKGGRP